ncbi:4491_t:CDS:10, partial [Diversispora eburnea]
VPNSIAHINCCHKYGVVMLGSDFEPYAKNLNNARVVFGASVIIGDDNFQNIISSRLTFVDKSMLVKEFIESSDFVSLILRPRRFGKSTNLSMLKHFFKIPYSQGENDVNKKLFEKLKISTECEIMQKHFEQYPIIHISLKDLNAETWNDMISELRILVAEIYGEHYHLINNLRPHEQTIYQQILERTCNISELKFSLKALSMYLRRHYKKKCIVLIDEYDSPMERAYNKGYYEVANDFFKGMFSSLLKSNSENVAKAMLVGVSRIAKSGFLSGLNNLKVYPLHKEHQFSLYLDKFGFTSDEVKLLLPLCKNLQINDARNWYDGYIAGGTIHLYNPWSIVNLLSDGILRNYWTETGSTQTLEKCIWKASSSFKESVEKLLKGYLNINSENHLFIPNDEIRSEWHRWVVNVPFFTKGQTIASMLDCLLGGNLDSFKKEFEQVIVDTLSFYDVGGSHSGENAEFVYHAFCLGMFANARDRGFTVLSNRESGYGRYDIAIFSESGGYEIAIIIEFKVVKKNKNLVDMARQGLDQIKEKQYQAGLHKDTKKLLEIGIAFEGKKACVLGHLLHRTEEATTSASLLHSLTFQKRLTDSFFEGGWPPLISGILISLFCDALWTLSPITRCRTIPLAVDSTMMKFPRKMVVVYCYGVLSPAVLRMRLHCADKCSKLIKVSPYIETSSSENLKYLGLSDLNTGIEINAHGSIVPIIPKQDLNNAQNLNTRIRLEELKVNQTQIPLTSSDKGEDAL